MVEPSRPGPTGMPGKREETATESRDALERPRTPPPAQMLKENHSTCGGWAQPEHFNDPFCKVQQLEE